MTNSPDSLPYTRQNNVEAQINAFADINSFKGSSFKLAEGNNMLNALSFRTDVTTVELLKVHLLRIVYTFLLFVYMKIYLAVSFFHQVCLFFSTLWFVLKQRSGYTENWWRTIDLWVWYRIFTNVPTVFCQVTKMWLVSSSPRNMNQFECFLPHTLGLPSSTAIVLHMSENTISLPPDVPQPYLDANKEIQVPSKKQMQQVLSQRNEYFVQWSTFEATEKVRLLSETSRYVLWCCLLPTTEFAVVYEQSGCLWEGEDEISVMKKLQTLSVSIETEFESFAATAGKISQPSVIVLTEVVTGVSLPIVSDFAATDESTITIYLSDERSIQAFKAGSSEAVAPIPELTMAFSSLLAPVLLDGFFALADTAFQSETTQLVTISDRFGFRAFWVAMIMFSKARSHDELANVLSSASVNLQPAHYLVKFFYRLSQLRLFDLNSSKEDASD